MKFNCRGVRGSRPVPLGNEEMINLYSRLTGVFGRDILKYANKPKEFLRGILDSERHILLGVGGNTPSVEVLSKNKSSPHVVFDLGTGASKIKIEKSRPKVVHVFITHFHYDHVQGLPFISWMYDKDVDVHFYNPEKNFESILRNVMRYPYFPITMEGVMTPNVHFHTLSNKKSIKIDDMVITWKALRHPGGSYAYKIVEREKAFCYFTDVNIQRELFEDIKGNRDFLEGIDVIVIDSSMSFVDSITTKRYWGHSSAFEALNLCNKWNIKNAYLFHYDPVFHSSLIALLYQTALWYNKAIQSSCKIFLSREDAFISV